MTIILSISKTRTKLGKFKHLWCVHEQLIEFAGMTVSINQLLLRNGTWWLFKNFWQKLVCVCKFLCIYTFAYIYITLLIYYLWIYISNIYTKYMYYLSKLFLNSFKCLDFLENIFLKLEYEFQNSIFSLKTVTLEGSFKKCSDR